MYIHCLYKKGPNGLAAPSPVSQDISSALKPSGRTCDRSEHIDLFYETIILSCLCKYWFDGHTWMICARESVFHVKGKGLVWIFVLNHFTTNCMIYKLFFLQTKPPDWCSVCFLTPWTEIEPSCEWKHNLRLKSPRVWKCHFCRRAGLCWPTTFDLHRGMQIVKRE